MLTYFRALARPEQLSIARRLDAHLVIVGDCWVFRGAKSHNGYGHLRTRTGCARAHRVAYEIANGPIPAGLHVDHVQKRGCRSRACCRPAHLEAITQAENNRRAAEARRERRTAQALAVAA